MVTQVSPITRDGLDANGYGIQFMGFGHEEVPLYAHTPKGDKQVGDIVTRKRVVDRRHLTEDEGVYFDRKAAAGLFPWPPAECLDHTFRDERIVRVGEGRAKLSRGEAYRGCKWCRERHLNKGSEDGAVLEGEDIHLSSEPSRDESEASSSAAPVPAIPKHKFQCPLCEGGSETETGFKVHMSRKHTSTPKKRGTRRKAGAGKEQK